MIDGLPDDPIIAAADAEVARKAADPGPGPSFHDVLHAMNPLQYVPVIGTIYRAVTGDTVPEGARMAGSFAVSGLTGGPVGVAVTMGLTLLEKITGIDPDRIGQSVLASLGVGEAPDPAPKPSPDQLAAYGVPRSGPAASGSDDPGDFVRPKAAAAAYAGPRAG